MFILLIALVLPFTFAQADVLVEPMIGYETGTLDYETTPPGALEDQGTKGAGMGARLGYDALGLQLAFDYYKGSFKDDDDETYKTTELGAFIGYNFWFLRAYAAYLFSVKDEDDGKAKGYKIGASFYPLSWVALSFEYKTYEFDPVQGVDYKLDAVYSGGAFILSFPFRF